jgi:hypothetical protein
MARRWCAELESSRCWRPGALGGFLAVRVQVVLLQMVSASRLALSRSVSISSEFMN